MLSIGITAGLIAMLCWGIADYFQAIIVRKMSSIKYMFYSSLMTFFITSLLFIPFFFSGMILFSKTTILILLAAGLLDIFAAYCFMRSMEIGDIAIVTPISATYSLVTVVLAYFFLGERLSVLQTVSVLVIFLGILLVSTDLRKLKDLHTVKGVKEALVTMVLWGVFFLLLAVAKKPLASNPSMNIAITLFFSTSLINSFMMTIFAAIRKGNVKFDEMKLNFLPVFGIFVLYTIAWIAYNYGFVNGIVSIVTPVSSLYPAITVLLAVVFLKEKLLLNQKIGAFAILIGIFLLSL